MKKMIRNCALVLTGISTATSLSFASGRDIVDKVESDELETRLVNSVIKTYGLQCQRPNLVFARPNLNVLNFKIKYNCQSEMSPEDKFVISVAGSIEDSQVTMTSFSFKEK